MRRKARGLDLCLPCQRVASTGRPSASSVPNPTSSPTTPQPEDLCTRCRSTVRMRQSIWCERCSSLCLKCGKLVKAPASTWCQDCLAAHPSPAPLESWGLIRRKTGQANGLCLRRHADHRTALAGSVQRQRTTVTSGPSSRQTTGHSQVGTSGPGADLLARIAGCPTPDPPPAPSTRTGQEELPSLAGTPADRWRSWRS